MPKDKGSKKSIKLNFSGVDEEIRKHTERTKRIPEGDYIAKIVEGEIKTSEEKGTKYINWKFQILKPAKFKGVTVYGMTSLKTEALWNLRNLINAATGKNVAGKALNLNLENLEGKIVGIAVEDNEYKKDGKTKISSRVNTTFPKDEWEEKDLDEDDDEEDDDDEEEEEEEEDDDEEELEDVEVENI